MEPSRAAAPLQISGASLLLVEGKDDECLAGALLKTMGLGAVQLIRYEGVTKLRSSLAAVSADDEFRAVRAVGVMRDADDSPAAALQSVADALAAVLGSPPLTAHGQLLTFDRGEQKLAVGAFVVPDGSRPGALEDLCLEAVASLPAMPCVEAYIECLTGAGVEVSSRAKTAAHAFLASCRRPEWLLGQAAEAGCWNLDHAVWDPLKHFLRDLAQP